MPDWRKSAQSGRRSAPPAARRSPPRLADANVAVVTAADLWNRLVNRSSTCARPDELSQIELAPLARHPPPPRLAPSKPRTARQRRNAGKMKFAHSLLFNAVPDWTNHYLA